VVTQEIQTFPWPRVRLNGRRVSERGQFRHTLSLPPGDHKITLENPNCYPSVMPVTVRSDSRSPLPDRRVTLRWLPAYVEVDGPPKAVVYYVKPGGGLELLGEARRGLRHELAMDSRSRTVELRVVAEGGVRLATKRLKLRPKEHSFVQVRDIRGSR